jgi:hypothetical protein
MIFQTVGAFKVPPALSLVISKFTIYFFAFLAFFPFSAPKKKLDPGKSIELSRNYIQISDGTGSYGNRE